MSRLRFSLASLLMFTLLVAVTCAALRYATDLWASAAVSLAAGLLLTGLLAALLLPARAFWLGFALFGLAYFYVSVATNDVVLRSYLPTTRLLQYLDARLHPDSSAAALAGRDIYTLHKVWLINGTGSQPVPTTSNFQAIGHSAFAILCGLLGGAAGCLIRGAAPSPAPVENRSLG